MNILSKGVQSTSMGFGDLGKKSVLKRTKIEYSAAEPLADKIASHPITIDLIEDLFDFLF